MPSQGSEEILQQLIDRGANVNAIDKDGHTALDAAIEANKSEGKMNMNCVSKSSFTVETQRKTFFSILAIISGKTLKLRENSFELLWTRPCVCLIKKI